ncbi:MAG: hypothetical protein KDD40_08330, partial [Bdellovibrionales bacterium]|nr:hypothetical protein [Bdellovibrionales bacterium]
SLIKKSSIDILTVMNLKFLLIYFLVLNVSFQVFAVCPTDNPVNMNNLTIKERSMQLAYNRLVSWVRNRSRGFSNNTSLIFGPSIDGTYFFRLGEHGDDGRYANGGLDVSIGESIQRLKEELLATGLFPKYQTEESMLASFANNAGRALERPEIKRCAKHFPGGDETLEFTEKEKIHFGNPKTIENYLQPFKLILDGSYPPDCIMMGHATYSRIPFDAEELQDMGPLFGKIPFEKLPASLNPGLTKYLREELGFKGFIYPDWYDMGAIEQFLDEFIAERGAGLSKTLVLIYLSTYANIDKFVVTYTHAKLKSEIDNLPDSIQKHWRQKLLSQMPRYLKWSDSLGLMNIVNELPLEDLVYIKATGSVETQGQLTPAFLYSLGVEAAEKLYKPNGLDPWNRTGVLVLLLRQFFVEEMSKLTNNQLSATVLPPVGIDDEQRWFDQLNGHIGYEALSQPDYWETEEMKKVFCRIGLGVK